MTKQETMTQLADAKKAHIKWMIRAKSLIEGIPVEKDAIPLDSTECAFGEWFYGAGQQLNALPNNDCLDMIETLHASLHDLYLRIFKIYFGTTDRSVLSRLFGTKRKVSQAEKEMAREQYAALESVSKELLHEITKLERRLYAMPHGVLEEKLSA